MGQPAYLEKITSVRGRDCPAQKDLAYKASTGFLFNKSDNGNHKDFLKSNKPRSSKTPARSPQALTSTSQNLDVN